MKISKIISYIDHNHLCALGALVVSASSIALVTYDYKHVDIFETISLLIFAGQMTIETVNQGASKLLETTQLWSNTIINEFKNVTPGITNIYKQLQSWVKYWEKTLPTLLKENNRKKIIFYISKIPELPLLVIKYLEFIITLHKKSFGFADEVLSNPNFTTLITSMKDLSLTKSEVFGSLNQEGLARIADYLVENSEKTDERIQKMIKKAKELMWSREFFNDPEKIINALTENHTPKRRNRSSRNKTSSGYKTTTTQVAKHQNSSPKNNSGKENKQSQMSKNNDSLKNLKTLLDKNIPEIIKSINNTINEIKNLIDPNQIENEVTPKTQPQTTNGDVISDTKSLVTSGLEDENTNAINEENGEEIKEVKEKEIEESQFQKYVKDAIKMIIESTSGKIETKKQENLKNINRIAVDLEKIWKILITKANY